MSESHPRRATSPRRPFHGQVRSRRAPAASYLPMSHELFRGNAPCDRPRGLRPWRTTSRPSKVARTCVRRRALSSRRCVLVCAEVRHGDSVRRPCSQRRASHGRKRSLVHGAPSRLPSSCRCLVARLDVPCGGLVRGRPPSPPASCRGWRPPAPSLPPHNSRPPPRRRAL